MASSFLLLMCCTCVMKLTQAHSTTRSKSFWTIQERKLQNREYAKITTADLQQCAQKCMKDVNCKSANFDTEKSTCELNYLGFTDPVELTRHQGSIYIQEVNTPPEGTHAKYAGFSSSLSLGRLAKTCREIYSNGWSSGNGAYPLLTNDGTSLHIYCHMDNIPGCGDGGWSLAMKIDGRKSTFTYTSNLWSNKVAYNPAAAGTGFDSEETKTPVYWSGKATKLCLRMRPTDSPANTTFQSLVLRHTADSLFDAIADGKYRGTSLGRGTWLSLLPDSVLQPQCNREGFNSQNRNKFAKARIGILGNNENNCNTPDSVLGFGTGGRGCRVDFSGMSCGNRAPGCGTPKRETFAFGYILIQ